MNCARELEVVKALAVEAGAKLLRFRFENEGGGPQRGSGESMSVAGLVADDVICSGLADAFPDDGLCSRHSGRQAGWTGRVWLVDALDGEENYLLGADEFAVSIGLAVHGKPALGVVFNPARQEMFAGRMEMGASLNGQTLPAQITAVGAPAEVLAPQPEWQEAAAVFQGRVAVIPAASVAYALARVAAGRHGGVISLAEDRGCKTCSGAALVEAAGGRATLLNGGDIYYRSDAMVQPTGIVAGPQSRHAFLLAILRDVRGTEPEGAGQLGNVA